MSVVRFGVSLEKEILKELDDFVNKNHFANRSQAIRSLISTNLAKKDWEENQDVAGAISLVYDHHKRDLLNKLADIQHDYFDIILSAQHFHLDHDNCLEIIAVKGKAFKLKDLANKLIAIKGIQHGTLSMSNKQ
ncbi:MAG: nickel-responsive transcriptional regulator NikR [Marinilabiliales bacterium]|nr:MAG: nickel-responsive transcriptional regulator NikR [Marinilabiliales bacterium]